MWSDLTMGQKAEVMKMAVKSGIYNLDDVQKLYNTSLTDQQTVQTDDDKGKSGEQKQRTVRIIPKLIDKGLHKLDQMGAPSHVMNAVRDILIRKANRPVIAIEAAYNRLSGKAPTMIKALKQADTNPSRVARFFEVFPEVNTEDNYTQEELANQYELRMRSPGPAGQITNTGYKKVENSDGYARDISISDFNTPVKVNEWSIGQTSGTTDETGHAYTSDVFAYDLKDTKGVYAKSLLNGNVSVGKLLRLGAGIIGSKGYNDNTNSATAIQTKIDTDAQREAYEKVNGSQGHTKAYGGSVSKDKPPLGPIQIAVLRDAPFIQRLKNPDRTYIRTWEDPKSISTTKMGWVTDDNYAIVYPEVQDIGDELIDFTRPPWSPDAGWKSAIQRRDTLHMTPEQADWFTKHYKEYYPKGKKFEHGGSTNPTEPLWKKYITVPEETAAQQEARIQAAEKVEKQNSERALSRITSAPPKEEGLQMASPILKPFLSIAALETIGSTAAGARALRDIFSMVGAKSFYDAGKENSKTDKGVLKGFKDYVTSPEGALNTLLMAPGLSSTAKGLSRTSNLDILNTLTANERKRALAASQLSLPEVSGTKMSGVAKALNAGSESKLALREGIVPSNLASKTTSNKASLFMNIPQTTKVLSDLNDAIELNKQGLLLEEERELLHYLSPSEMGENQMNAYKNHFLRAGISRTPAPVVTSKADYAKVLAKQLFGGDTPEKMPIVKQIMINTVNKISGKPALPPTVSWEDLADALETEGIINYSKPNGYASNPTAFIKELYSTPSGDKIVRSVNYNENENMPYIGGSMSEEVVKRLILSHELTHVLQEMLLNHTRHGSKEFKGFNYKNLSPEYYEYFTKYNGTEILARLSQILDFYGIKDQTTKITPAQIRFAKKYYMGVDNDMVEFLNMIEDENEVCTLINHPEYRKVLSLVPAAGVVGVGAEANSGSKE